MTSNPTIFEKALAEGHAYDDQLAGAPAGLTALELFELVETTDVRDACDIFMPVYERTKGGDGYVSIEVSPGRGERRATRRSPKRSASGRRSDRPNVMIKVPGTDGGRDRRAPAHRRGHQRQHHAALRHRGASPRDRGVPRGTRGPRCAAGKPIDRVASVASFFVSRVDTEIDKRLDALAAAASGEQRDRILALRGKAAIANAQLAYRLFRERVLRARAGRRSRPQGARCSVRSGRARARRIRRTAT